MEEEVRAVRKETGAEDSGVPEAGDPNGIDRGCAALRVFRKARGKQQFEAE